MSSFYTSSSSKLHDLSCLIDLAELERWIFFVFLSGIGIWRTMWMKLWGLCPRLDWLPIIPWWGQRSSTPRMSVSCFLTNNRSLARIPPLACGTTALHTCCGSASALDSSTVLTLSSSAELQIPWVSRCAQSSSKLLLLLLFFHAHHTLVSCRQMMWCYAHQVCLEEALDYNQLWRAWWSHSSCCGCCKQDSRV